MFSWFQENDKYFDIMSLCVYRVFRVKINNVDIYI